MNTAEFENAMEQLDADYEAQLEILCDRMDIVAVKYGTDPVDVLGFLDYLENVPFLTAWDYFTGDLAMNGEGLLPGEYEEVWTLLRDYCGAPENTPMPPLADVVTEVDNEPEPLEDGPDDSWTELDDVIATFGRACPIKMLDAPRNVAWFDVECVKEAVSHPDWPLKVRTVPVMVGVLFVDWRTDLVTFLQTELEADTVRVLQTLADAGYELRYSATHNYDEMVVTGRWLYVRRAPLAEPGPFPAVEWAIFRNIRKGARNLNWFRGTDVDSKEIPSAWFYPGWREAIRVHNRRDVWLLVANDPEVVLSDVDVERVAADLSWNVPVRDTGIWD
jgi:hypothetical protein